MATTLLRAQVRYWLTVAPWVRRELCSWQVRARRIDDPVLRAHALEKLAAERANTEGIATLCTLAPRKYRRPAVNAAVALQVMYDYLDAVTEQPAEDRLRSGRQLFRTFAVALTPAEGPIDYYRYHSQREHSGYLDALVTSCRRSIAELPSTAAVLPTARDAAQRFGEAQVRSHAVPWEGEQQLRDWARVEAAGKGLTWWEWASGAAGSVLAVHALLSAAADARTTRLHALRIDDTYLLSCALTTLLDSLVDDEGDAAEGAHRYIAYYPSVECAAQRIATIARRAVASTRDLPHSAHHAMTVAGIAAFYLSTPDARGAGPRLATAEVRRALGPIVLPILIGLRLWRRAKRLFS